MERPLPQPRCRDRAAAWRTDTAKSARYYLEKATTPEQRAALEAAHTEAVAEGPDFTRYHRGSDFRQPPRVNTDRNALARIMFMADTIERKSWAIRPKGKHGGVLGRSALTVLRTLLFVVSKRDGCLFPSLETIARLARMSVPTAVKAIATLTLMGFLTVYRRIKRIRTPLGIKTVQDSNCYDYHPPTGLGALSWALWKPQTKANFMQGQSQVSTREADGGRHPLSPDPALLDALQRLQEGVRRGLGRT